MAHGALQFNASDCRSNHNELLRLQMNTANRRHDDTALMCGKPAPRQITKGHCSMALGHLNQRPNHVHTPEA
jgi:hypothetical protein